MKRFKKIICFILVITFTFIVLGCENQEQIKRDVIPQLVDDVVSDTQKAILEKDLKLARETWSKVTKYSVKANELGDKELSEALSRLATTYVRLIDYCENGKEDALEIFNFEFAKALEKIKNVGTVVSKTQAYEPVFLCDGLSS